MCQAISALSFHAERSSNGSCWCCRALRASELSAHQMLSLVTPPALDIMMEELHSPSKVNGLRQWEQEDKKKRSVSVSRHAAYGAIPLFSLYALQQLARQQTQQSSWAVSAMTTRPPISPTDLPSRSSRSPACSGPMEVYGGNIDGYFGDFGFEDTTVCGIAPGSLGAEGTRWQRRASLVVSALVASETELAPVLVFSVSFLSLVSVSF